MLLDSPAANNNNPQPNTSSNNKNEDEDNESGVADLSIVVSDTSGSTAAPTAVADASNSSLGSLSTTSHNNNNTTSASSFVLRDPTAVNELQEALSRRNSFINYFDNKLNVPDVTVPNLLDAVNYIIQSIRK